MTRLLLVITEAGGDIKAAYIGEDGEQANAAYSKAKLDASIDRVRIYRWPSHSEAFEPKAFFEAEKAEAKKLKEAKEAAEKQAKVDAASELEAAEEALKAAKAKAKELGLK